MTRLLLVEDEDRLARSLALGFEDHDYLVERAADGEEGLLLARSERHDALILDLRLPRMGGLELCRRLRREGSRLPILMLTASDTTAAIVEGLDAGADDYLTKPFRFEELLARVRALVRRGSAGSGVLLTIGDLRLDSGARRVWRGDDELACSALEYRLLEHLMRNVGKVQTRARLASALWHDPLGPDSNVLEVLISKLRKKIDRAEAPSLIRTRRGEGYVLELPT